jgi:hypothetical protein
MATQKSNRGTKGQGSVDFSSRFRNAVGDGANVANNEKRESVPWSLLITLIAVLITFFIVMPIMGYMYVDLINIREAWVVEVKKARKINKQLQEELWLRSNNSGN